MDSVMNSVIGSVMGSLSDSGNGSDGGADNDVGKLTGRSSIAGISGIWGNAWVVTFVGSDASSCVDSAANAGTGAPQITLISRDRARYFINFVSYWDTQGHAKTQTPAGCRGLCHLSLAGFNQAIVHL